MNVKTLFLFEYFFPSFDAHIYSFFDAHISLFLIERTSSEKILLGAKLLKFLNEVLSSTVGGRYIVLGPPHAYITLGLSPFPVLSAIPGSCPYSP